MNVEPQASRTLNFSRVESSRRRWLASLSLGSLILGATPLSAQSGRFNLLAPISGHVGRCDATPERIGAIPPEANRTFTLYLDDEPSRVLSVTTSPRGSVATFTTNITVSAGANRREGERLTADYDPNGRLLSGMRTAFALGTPAKASEPARQALSPSEAADALELAKRLVARCAR